MSMPVPGDALDEKINDVVGRADAARREARRQARLAGQGPVHRYQPYGTAVEAFKFTGPELLSAGPAGTGKSKCLLE